MRGARRAALWASLLLACAAWAAPPKVTVRVALIHASDKGNVVEPPSLRAMKASFTQSGFHFQSYRQIFSRRLILEQGHSEKIALPNHRTATLRLESVSKNVARIHVSIPPLETTYALGRKGSVFLQAGPHQGGVLILVLSPSTR